MHPKSYSIFAGRGSKSAVEHAAQIIFTVCGFFAVLAVASITAYMIISGTPALFKVGIIDILFGTVWKPEAAVPAFGILYVILTSIAGTALAILIGVPIGVMTAVFLAEVAPPKLAGIVRPAVELLAIPSVIYGLLGILILNPLMYKLELKIFEGSTTHQFTGGANLISAVLVLALMILPTVINISESALPFRSQRNCEAPPGSWEPQRFRRFSRLYFQQQKSGIITAIVLGTGRAIGEAMAISLCIGKLRQFPLPFNSVRFLTTAIVSEMSYSAGLHKQVLFTIGLVLFAFIMIINISLTRLLKKGDVQHD